MKIIVLIFLFFISIHADNSLYWQDNDAVRTQEYDIDEAKAYCEALNLN